MAYKCVWILWILWMILVKPLFYWDSVGYEGTYKNVDSYIKKWIFHNK